MTLTGRRPRPNWLAIVCLAMVAWNTAHADWFSPDWTYRKSVQFQASQVTADLAGFPALVSIVDADLQASAQGDGDDIVFALEDGTQLAHEIERYDGATGELVAWVRVPQISATDDTEVFLYYGNPGAGNQEAPSGVWDAGFRLVHHLEEPGGRNTPLLDSTQYGNGGVVLGRGNNFPSYLANGLANGARAHPGQLSPGNSPDPTLSFSDFGDPGLSTSFTAEAWARVDNSQSGRDHHPIFWKGSIIGWGPNYFFRIAVRQNRTITWGVTCGGSEEWFNGGAAGQGWSHYAISFDGNVTRAYVDGQLVATDSGCSGEMLNVTSEPFQSGYGRVNNGQESVLNGDVDEFRVSTVVRSGDWLRTHFNNVSAPSGFHQIGPEETDSATTLTCAGDDFSSTALGSDWETNVSSGSFTPSIVDGRLRMTEASGNQSTAATFQRLIPGADNFVRLEFDYFAYGGSGADGLAVVFSDAAITPQPGSFGGSLGYAQRDNGDAGFAGGWLGIGLDEYGNFSNPTEGRQGGPGFVRDAVAIRGAEQSDYPYLGGTGTLNPGIDQGGNNPSPHRYRITIDSRGGAGPIVEVRRDTSGTGNNFQTLVQLDLSNFPGQPATPENLFLSLTGSTGGSTNIHELDNLELCAEKLNPVGVLVDHFEFVHDGIALTCQPETVTIKACENADCSTLHTDPVDVTLDPTGWVDGDSFTFSGGQTTRSLQVTTASTVTLGVASSDPSAKAFTQTLCDNGSGTLSAANCELEFVESGLAFDIPDLTSHRPAGPIEIRAVRQDDETQACVPAFENVQKSVQFWSTYVDPGPNGRPVSRPVSVNGTDVSGDQSAPTVFDLDFGPGGIAEVEVMYPDAGQMQLDAWYIGSAATEDDGLVMPGADSFISVPAGLCVSAAGECAAGDATCPTFVRAGEDFDLSITAVGWEVDGDSNLCQGNPVTPNFRLLNITLASTVVSPSGKENGVLEPGDYSHTRSVDATEVVTAHISEVGVFQFTATPDDGDYLGLTVPGGTSAPIGRFYPDTFNVTVDPGELQAECTAGTPFTYTGQDFNWLIAPSLLIEPLSVQGSATLNYTETGFQRLSAGGVARVFPVADSTTVNTDGNPMTVTTTKAGGSLSVINPGLLQFEFSSVSDDAFRYDKVPEARVAPFNPDLAFTITDVVDADGVPANAAPYDFTPAANFDIRYGRLAMDNAYGPETSGLVIPMRAEYFDGTRFVVNDAESCWTYNLPDDVVLDFSESALSDGDTEVVEVADSDLTLNGGVPVYNSTDDYRIRLAAPGVGKSESPDQRGINVEFVVEDWLRDFWDPNAPTTLLNPSALATFGVYRGHDRVIYWREQ